MKNRLIPVSVPVLIFASGLLSFLASDEGVTRLIKAGCLLEDHREWGQSGLFFLFVATGILLLAASIANAFFSTLLSKLRDRNIELEKQLAATEEDQQMLGALISLWQENLQLLLARLAYEYGFSSSERITIYLHENDTFRPVARFSKNPQAAAIHRQSYPIDKGCIAQAWEKEESYLRIKALPDGDNPDKYYAKQGEVGIERDVAENFTMKSRAYAGVRINKGDEALAVLMFESTKDDRLESAPAGHNPVVSDGRPELNDYDLRAISRALDSIDPSLLPKREHASALEAGVAGGAS